MPQYLGNHHVQNPAVDHQGNSSMAKKIKSNESKPDIWEARKAKGSEIRIEFLASRSTFGKPQTREQVRDLDEASDKFAKFVDFQGHRDFGCV